MNITIYLLSITLSLSLSLSLQRSKKSGLSVSSTDGVRVKFWCTFQWWGISSLWVSAAAATRLWWVSVRTAAAAGLLSEFSLTFSRFITQICYTEEHLLDLHASVYVVVYNRYIN